MRKLIFDCISDLFFFFLQRKVDDERPSKEHRKRNFLVFALPIQAERCKF